MVFPEAFSGMEVQGKALSFVSFSAIAQNKMFSQCGKGKIWVEVVRITLPFLESSKERAVRRLVFPPLPITALTPLSIPRASANEGREVFT